VAGSKLIHKVVGTANTLIKENEMSEPSFTDQVNKVLEEKIAPALAMDGGHCELVEIKDKVIFLRLGGACSGCPSSTITLKSGIERILRQDVDPEILVEQAW
jgi:NFU1 iron-sulfur cluster scaffold homolog, mitochondrial